VVGIHFIPFITPWESIVLLAECFRVRLVEFLEQFTLEESLVALQQELVQQPKKFQSGFKLLLTIKTLTPQAFQVLFVDH
jgi:hypothetical protein